jgi:hypothetical protein
MRNSVQEDESQNLQLYHEVLGLHCAIRLGSPIRSPNFFHLYLKAHDPASLFFDRMTGKVSF